METSAEPSFEALYLIGVRLHPGHTGSHLYTLLLVNEEERSGKDRPLTDNDGYVVWFAEPERADSARTLGDAAFRNVSIAPLHLAARYDFALLFWTVSHGIEEVSGGVVDALNLLLDLVDATGFPIPADYRAYLFALADHLTFSGNLEAFIAGGEDLRARLMDAITWCIGAITIKSRILSSSTG